MKSARLLGLLLLCSAVRGVAGPRLQPAPKLVQTLRHPYVRFITVSPDGETLASSSSEEYIGPGEVRLWNSIDRKLLRSLRYEESAVQRLAMSPDSKMLAVPHDKVNVVDVATGRQKTMEMPDAFDMKYSVAFSPNGRYLAAGGSMAETGHTDVITI